MGPRASQRCLSFYLEVSNQAICWDRGRPARNERKREQLLFVLLGLSEPGTTKGQVAWFFTQASFHRVVLKLLNSLAKVLFVSDVSIKIVVDPEFPFAPQYLVSLVCCV